MFGGQLSVPAPNPSPSTNPVAETVSFTRPAPKASAGPVDGLETVMLTDPLPKAEELTRAGAITASRAG